MRWIGKSHMAEIIIALSKQKETYFTELAEIIKLKNYNKINLRLNELKDMGLIDDEYEDKFARKRYISLTEKGKEIANDLIKIDNKV